MDKPDSFGSNFNDFEKGFRELKSELYMKRNEVLKLKSELELITQENHKLKTSLDRLKKQSEENEITMDLFIKKSKEFEPRYYEKRDALIKLELQYKNATSKNDSLRQDLQDAITHKAQLLRKVDVLEEKQTRDTLYINEISQKFIQLKTSMATVTEDLEKLKKGQTKVNSILQQIDLSQEALRKCEEISKLNEKLKQENATLDEQCVTFKAKLETINNVFSKHSLPDDSDMEAKVLLMQCKKISSFYREAMKIKNALLNTLNTSLGEEKATNLKLIQENEQLCDKLTSMEKLVKELETKLCVYEPNLNNHPVPPTNTINMPEQSDIKEENDQTFIEIKDSQ